MKTFSATDAAISGFRLVSEHPKAVGAWVIVSTIVSAIVAVITIGLFGSDLEAFAALSQNSSADPTETLQAMSKMGWFFLFSLVYSLVFYSVLLTAIYRVVLRPQDSKQVYLRLGADELRQIGVSILLVVLLLAIYFGLAVVLGLTVAIVAVAAKPAAALMGIVMLCGGVCTLIYVATRLSLANVLTFATGKIDIFGSWRLTKGRFWPMFGAYFVATVLFFVVYVLLALFVTLLGGALSGFDLESLGQLMQTQTTTLDALLTPIGVLSLAVGGLMAVLTSVTIYTPSAAIYREIATLDAEAPAPAAPSGPFDV
ncbi:MAG: hypothetical protein QM608_03920 [Caulobacter sp.]